VLAIPKEGTIVSVDRQPRTRREYRDRFSTVRRLVTLRRSSPALAAAHGRISQRLSGEPDVRGSAPKLTQGRSTQSFRPHPPSGTNGACAPI